MEHTTWRRSAVQWALAVGALVGLVVMAVMYWPDVVAATRGLEDARPLLVAVALGAQVLAVGAAAATYRAAAHASGATLRPRAALEAALGASTLSRVLPAGGAVGVWYATRRLCAAGLERVTAMTAAVLVGVVTVTVLPLVVVAGATAAAAHGEVGWGPVLASGLVAALVAVGLGLAAVLVRHNLAAESPEPARGVLGRMVRRTGLDGDTLRGVLAVAGDPRALLGVGVAAVRYWLLDMAVLWLVFAAFGVTLHPGLVVVGTGAANLAAALPITPGGLGLAEAGMGATFVALGVPAGLAVTVVLTYRLLSLWLPGLVALAVCNRRPRPVTA